MKHRLAGVLAAVLCLSPLSALAADFSDLPQDHWAYSLISRAEGMGIVKGVTDTTVQPDGSLTAGAFLTMLDRALWPDSVPAAAPGQHWAAPAYEVASAMGAVPDYVQLSADALDRPVDRKDTAAVLYAALSGPAYVRDLPGAELTFTDAGSIPEQYHTALAQLSGREIVNGFEDGSFGGDEPLTRAQGTAMLLRLVDCAAAQAEESEDEDSRAPEPEEELLTPESGWEPEWDQVWVPLPGFGTGTADREPLLRLDDNDAKRMLLYGTAEYARFPSQAEAEAAMTTVTVPVWHLKDGGTKVSAKQSFTIHRALADDLTAIFTEIYNDPEQFPIYEIGGYQWRGDSSTSEHCSGTALDINANENCQITPAGVVTAGALWQPGVNAYSIAEGGSVVRIFNAHGWTWGGNGWPASSSKDYMHFSYLGR